ncbi:hypothetical protein IFO70_10100 [Phormidium tenue FACHB-886]|nr:hypothetical protein [Phormidium tenue FACHB-886]
MTIALFEPTWGDLKSTPIGEWITVLTEQGLNYLHIRGKHCMIALEARPGYCDRGRWLAKLEVLDGHELHMDWADGWSPGRFYFDLDRAKLEIEAWLKVRGQLEGEQ